MRALKIFRRLLEVCVIAGAICLATVGFAKDAPGEAEVPGFTTLEWTDLIPPADLEILLNPPQYVTQVEDGSVEDQISSQIQNSLEAASDDRYQQALSSTKVNAELNGAKIRLPGFIVPLEFDEEQTVTQFFLVPYFGACLHMPPPPPNQIILVNSPDGIQLQEFYMPFWILGELSTSITENDMATAAYSLRMAGIEAYTE